MHAWVSDLSWQRYGTILTLMAMSNQSNISTVEFTQMQQNLRMYEQRVDQGTRKLQKVEREVEHFKQEWEHLHEHELGELLHNIKRKEMEVEGLRRLAKDLQKKADRIEEHLADREHVYKREQKNLSLLRYQREQLAQQVAQHYAIRQQHQQRR
jgi:chromosome segregation ATPase